MKTFSVLVQLLRKDRGQRQNLGLLLQFCAMLGLIICVYSVLFHAIKLAEGENHSWITGFYWTFSTMTTLGYGDITFTTDLGRVFSIIVMLTGVFLLLVMLPFTFIEFFYAPWMRAQSTARAPREIPREWQGHVLFTALDPIATDLIGMLRRHGIPHAILVADLSEALSLHDHGWSVLVGASDDPDAWQRARIANAAMVVATANELANTNTTFTVRDLNGGIPIMVTARSDNGEEILKLAGATEVLRLGHLLGAAMARRTHGGDALAHVIGRFDDLIVAEALVRGTPLMGKTIATSGLKAHLGLTVACAWERGKVAIARADTPLTTNTVLVLVGTQQQIDSYDEAFCIYQVAEHPVLILGGGRVGRAVAKALRQRRIPFRILEKDPSRVDPTLREETLVGDATDPDVLHRASLDQTATVLITTHDDDTNIFLTICCRRLRPDVEIIGRATLARNVGTMHRAGADLVLSYAAMGANLIFNRLRRQSVMHVAEGLDLVSIPIGKRLADRSLVDLQLARTAGCLAVAIRHDGQTRAITDPALPLPAGGELIVVGDEEAERRLLAMAQG